MTAATLQELSEGRFLLGLAAGAEDFLAWAGIERQHPLRTTREAVVAIRALCSGAAPADVAGAGDGWRPEGRLRIPAAATPIYLGAMSPRMLELIGEVADGGLPLLYPPESFTAAVAHVAVGCARAGRALGDVDLAACIWVSVDATRNGRGVRWRRSSPTTAPRSLLGCSPASASTRAMARCGTSIRPMRSPRSRRRCCRSASAAHPTRSSLAAETSSPPVPDTCRSARRSAPIGAPRSACSVRRSSRRSRARRW